MENIENADKKQICMTCKWHSDNSTSVCVNDCSDRLSDFVMADETCDVWEKKTNDRSGT